LFFASPGATNRYAGHYTEVPTYIRNARLLDQTPTLDHSGFCLIKHATSDIDFSSYEKVERFYYPQMKEVFLQVTGADEIIIFDHTIRTETKQGNVRRPARHVHNDYTAASIVQRLIDLLGGDEAVAKLQNRFMELNLWRPLENRVQSSPLAIADASSIHTDDLVKAEIIYSDRKGEIYEVLHRDSQLWYYYPDMTPDEALVFIGYDSQPKCAGRFTPHTAFDDPTSPADAIPRKSIEFRAIAFFSD